MGAHLESFTTCAGYSISKKFNLLPTLSIALLNLDQLGPRSKLVQVGPSQLRQQ